MSKQSSSVRLASTVAYYLDAANVMAAKPVVVKVAGVVSGLWSGVKAWVVEQVEYSRVATQVEESRQSMVSRKGPVNDLEYRGDVPVEHLNLAPVTVVLDDQDLVVVQPVEPVAEQVKVVKARKPRVKKAKVVTEQVVEMAANQPVSRVDYSKLSYRELQVLCKEAGIKANSKREVLVAELEARLS